MEENEEYKVIENMKFVPYGKTKKKLGENIKSLKIINCENIEKIDYTGIEELEIVGGEAKFCEFNLDKVRKIVINNCNAGDMIKLLEIESLEKVELDGVVILDCKPHTKNDRIY